MSQVALYMRPRLEQVQPRGGFLPPLHRQAFVSAAPSRSIPTGHAAAIPLKAEAIQLVVAGPADGAYGCIALCSCRQLTTITPLSFSAFWNSSLVTTS